MPKPTDRNSTPAMRSQLEVVVNKLLTRLDIPATYESHTLPVTIVVNTQPDFYLPALQTVLEVKGKCQTSFEFRKLVATADTIREGVTYADVLYKHYVMAVQVPPADMHRYTAALTDINKLVTTTQRGSFPLTGLRLVAALQRAGVDAVPITYDAFSPLIQVLKRKKGLVQNG